MAKKTHREVKNPQISARFLADYMSASEIARRTIIRNCKYQPAAPIVQHKHARVAVSKFICGGSLDPAALTDRADQLRHMMADDDFTRDTLDHNADYLDRFASVQGTVDFPKAERLVPEKADPIDINGVKVTVDILFRLRRTTKTNDVRVGGGMVRYAKNRPLKPDVGAWQSAFLLGYLGATVLDEGELPEGKLCLTVDAFSGVSYPAPGDAISRFKNMGSACETIFERWENIAPPPNAVF